MDGHPPGGHLDEAFQLAMLNALTSGLDGYVSCIDRQRRILFLNRTFTAGISEILGKKIEDFITPPYREVAIEAVERAFTTQAPQQFESIVTLAQGNRRHISTRVVPFRVPGVGDVALQITTDVSEPRRLAEELQQSVEFRRRVVENLPDFVAVVNRERRFVWVNRTAPGLQMAEVIGAKLDAFVAADGLEQAIGVITNAFDAGVSGQYETRAYRDGQTQAWYTVRVAPLLGEARVEHVLLITTDITERKRAEDRLRDTAEQLHRAQRLESLGQLAGGIAHDFNNLLQVIEGNLAFAKQALNEGTSPREELEQATRAAERAAELTSHLLAIGRRTRVDCKPVELGELITHTVRLLRRSIPESVVLQYEPAGALYE
jgi:PAS domain S-box-containing protein